MDTIYRLRNPCCYYRLCRLCMLLRLADIADLTRFARLADNAVVVEVAVLTISQYAVSKSTCFCRRYIRNLACVPHLRVRPYTGILSILDAVKCEIVTSHSTMSETLPGRPAMSSRTAYSRSWVNFRLLALFKCLLRRRCSFLLIRCTVRWETFRDTQLFRSLLSILVVGSCKIFD